MDVLLRHICNASLRHICDASLRYICDASLRHICDAVLLDLELRDYELSSLINLAPMFVRVWLVADGSHYQEEKVSVI